MKQHGEPAKQHLCPSQVPLKLRRKITIKKKNKAQKENVKVEGFKLRKKWERRSGSLL